MADENDILRLRKLVGEQIAEGESEADTLFTDAELGDIIDRQGSVDDSLGEAWTMKAAQLSTLVDTIEGSSRRAMSDAHKAAMKMVVFYTGGSEAPRVTRVNKIVRS